MSKYINKQDTHPYSSLKTLLIILVSFCIVSLLTFVLTIFATEYYHRYFVNTLPRAQKHNLCTLFKAKPKWYTEAKASQKKWGAPIWTQMAIMHQESSFKSDARPPNKKILGISIPLTARSSAFGYPQALKGTWLSFQKNTGLHHAQRNKFDDSIYFVGWFLKRANKYLNIPYNNASQLYLAYHEGINGYRNKTYLKNPILLKTAQRVAKQAVLYKHQLKKC